MSRSAVRIRSELLLLPLAGWLLMALLAPGAAAQTVPADIAEVSIEDLFASNVVTREERARTSKRWHLAYRYLRSDYDEYRSGTRRLSYDDVLWSGPTEPRTDENYPVVPTEISQEVHSLLAAYDFSPSLSFKLSVPFIEQSTDHISIVPNYDEFNISSNGIGDVVALADYEVSRTVNSSLRVVAGVSIPTGSIDEEGDTPRAAGDQQLPYTMQIGSGTWDLPVALVFEKFEQFVRWGGDVRAVVRTGTNDRDYRLGHKFSLGSWVAFNNLDRFEPGIRLRYRWQDTISGSDGSLLLPNPQFPYPAPVVDPSAFGGQQVDLALFMSFDLGSDWAIRAEYSKPIWLNLNGPQSAENYHLSIGVSTTF